MTISNKTDIHYRYFDATKQAEYLFKTVEAAIDYELKKELEFVKANEPMKLKLDENLNLSDKDMGNVIRFCLQGNGNISKGKIK
ncbi:hypothetical protein MNBD_GAMMA07-2228 [hydrothermal vent metagenome]|uniref:Uncharacterized protein n=1 Tax=hydrothermal vent metagenome TaxID=652676 RepID=A0A3B0WWZ5_9ZZZZ